MKSTSILFLLLIINTSTFSQVEMESACIKEISSESKNTIFPIFNDSVILKGDTIHYNYSIIILRQSEPEALMIFKQGLLFPALILGASTGGDFKFKISSTRLISKLSISSFQEIAVKDQSPYVKSYSFLLWKENMVNPMLYILQLTNDKGSQTLNSQEFIEGSRLTAFGFCSILI